MKRRDAAIFALLVGLLAVGATPAQDSHSQERAVLVEQIARGVRETEIYTGIDRLDDSVMNAIGAVERHEFVPPDLRHRAYEDRPLPIGEGQTISQPYIVALMTHLAGVGPRSKVLEIGTGSGYQAAVLAEIVDHVYTIEIVESLGQRARQTLDRLGYDNLSVRIGDGYAGWQEAAPFDAILVTAAPEEVPSPLIAQLAAGGRLVVPVGSQGRAQSLQVMEKDSRGEIRTRDVLAVSFVPFTREN